MLDFKAEFNAEEQALIDSEFRRFGDTVYLDHAGTTLYAESQVSDAARTLQQNVYCNPHTCRATGDLVDQVRYKILDFFNTNSDEYDVIFTANSSAALKLVAECFRFTHETNSKKSSGNFYYCQDNHTSVLGMRAVVRATQTYMLTKDELLQNLTPPEESRNGLMHETRCGNSLVVYSAQCNFSGYKMPMELIDTIQRHGLVAQGTRVKNESHDNDKQGTANDRSKRAHYVCLDTASYVGSSFLDLNKHKPDFLCVSFYKMFGYPTGVGALIVSKRGRDLLEKKYYGGGTINFSFTNTAERSLRSGLHERFEDGTLPFLSIAELLVGYRTIEHLVPATKEKRSIERISAHVHQLAKYCHDELHKLRHANGAPVVELYNYAGYEKRSHQGGVVAFNLLNDVGSYVGYAEVACMAALHNIMLRTGCFCNLGACKSYLKLNDATIREQFMAGRVCGDYNDLINGNPTGAVRVSFGYMTRPQDIQRLLRMIRDCYITVKPAERLRRIERDAEMLPQSLQHIPQQLRPKLRQLCIYPIKSCAAFKIDDDWKLTEQGFQYDRQWMIVDGNGMAITQKKHTRLCMIQPQVNRKAGVLELSFENLTSVRVPLELNQPDANIVCQTKVCKTPLEGIDCGDTVAKWLSDVLETEGLRLITQGGTRRSIEGAMRKISFANQGQFLMINVASARWLANRLPFTSPEPLERTIDRFRANLIIETNAPFDELDFKQLQINGVHFNVDSSCTRCEMICIDQHTGEKSPEMLRTLAREFSGKMNFGIYVSLVEGLPANATIKCGENLIINQHE